MSEEMRKDLSAEQLKAYLVRVGIEEEPKDLPPTVETLDKLIKAHVRHVPFENSEVCLCKKTPSLVVDDLYKKIVTDRRGGYCFEMNLFFFRVLRALGFDVYTVLVSLSRPGVVGLTQPSHCGNIVRIDGLQRYADVGQGGGGPDQSVPLNGENRCGWETHQDGIYLVVGTVNEEGEFAPRYTFKNISCDPVEFLAPNFYVANAPDSRFRKALSMTLRVDNGKNSLANNHFTYRKDGIEIDKDVSTTEEMADIAREYFGVLNFPEITE